MLYMGPKDDKDHRTSPRLVRENNKHECPNQQT